MISKKGGVGKSTIARALAAELSKNNFEVKLADLDVKQGTCINWYQNRLSKELGAISSVEFINDKKMNRIIKNDEYDFLIIDTEAKAEKQTLKLAKLSNLIIQPSGPSNDDLIPGVKLFRALVEAGINKNKMYFVMNRIGTKTERRDTEEYINYAGYKYIDGCIYESPSYRAVQNTGKAITENPYKGPRIQAEIVMQSIIDSIDSE